MRAWPSPSKKESLLCLQKWFAMESPVWSNTGIEPGYRELADQIRAALSGITILHDWKTDVAVGLALYKSMPGVLPAVVADPCFWEWVNIQVVPDLVCIRWSINPDNFLRKNKLARFMAPRRNWCGSLWWCVHLVRTPSEDWVGTTENLLAGMTVDDLIAIVERPGQHGYRVDLMRALMARVIASRKKKADPMLIRRVMLLHSLRTPVLVPELFPGGTEGFAKALVIEAGGVE